MTQKLWFKAKDYGWGWYPATWQGWLSILIFTVLVALPAFIWQSDIKRNLFGYILYTMLMSSLFIFLCFRKGERPQWRWGDKN